MSDLISREDAIKAVTIAVLADKDEIEALEALPSAEGGDADITVIPEGTGLMQPCPDNGADLISRADAIEAVIEYWDGYAKPLDSWDVMNQTRAVLETLPSADAEPKWNCTANFVAEQLEKLKDMTDEERIKLLHILFPSADAEPSLKAIKRQIDEHWYLDPPSAEQGWIPCSERLPSDDEIVNITWVNHNPPPYYADIAEKPFVASGLRYRDKWYWYSSVCQDLHQDFDLIDKDIVVTAWMPLPTPYKGGDDE